MRLNEEEKEGGRGGGTGGGGTGRGIEERGGKRVKVEEGSCCVCAT